MNNNLMLKTILAMALCSFGSALAQGQETETVVVSAAPTSAYAQQFWSNPEFIKRFLGSYGFNSQIEPEVTDDEVELFRDLVELIQVDPQAAALKLQEEMDGNSSAALNFVLANLYFQDGDLDNAAKYYSVAIEKFPDFRRAHKNLGLLKMQQQDLAGAAEHLSRAIELGDYDGRNYGLLGYCYLDSEDYVAAESAYRTAILQEPKVNDWKLGLAQALLGQEEYSEAHALFQSLIEADPTNADLWLYQVNTALGMDRAREAAVNIEVVRRLGGVKPSSLKLLGDVYMSLRIYDNAVEVYEELLSQDEKGQYKDAGMRTAKYLTMAGRSEQASMLIETVETRYPDLTEDDQIELLLLKAQVARKEGNDEQAKQAFADIVERDPLNGEALMELASYEQGAGNTAKAMFLYGNAAKVDGFEFKALLSQARIKVSERKFDEAIPLLRTALQYKDDERVAQFLERVERAAKNT
ncbi:MAG: tetratricopeptide repeat protein [Puniceicoccales bacterium]